MNALRDAMTRRVAFRGLHELGLFVMPNPWDVGSARMLESLGFKAVATTSSGSAAAMGRPDYGVDRDELLSHVELLTAAVDLPLSVDAERCFADDPSGVAETVDLIANAGAAGCSRTTMRAAARSTRLTSRSTGLQPQRRPPDAAEWS